MVPINQPHTTLVTFHELHLWMPLRYEFGDGVSNTASCEEHLQTTHKCTMPIGCGYWESVCREHLHTPAKVCKAPQAVDTRESLSREHLQTTQVCSAHRLWITGESLCREHLQTITQVCSSHRLWVLGSPCVKSIYRLHYIYAMPHRPWIVGVCEEAKVMPGLSTSLSVFLKVQ